MELSDEILINAPREKVFAALNDTGILREAIPGCQDFDALEDGVYEAAVGAKVGPLKAVFKGQATVSDVVVPESYVITGDGRGGSAGHAKVSAHVHLEAEGEKTRMRYEVKADIGGKLAQLGGPLVKKTAQKLAGIFFSRFEKLVADESDSEAVKESRAPAQ